VLTRQLLSFSRGQPIRPRPTDLVELLEESGAMLERLIGEDIEYTMHLPAEPVVVRVDPSQIERMVVNLVTNARDAMPDGGRLRVGLEARFELESTLWDGLPEDHYALITVDDSGEGMGPEQIDHAFEPFFTTKRPDAGTGLGLATVRSIADQCGGGAFIESTPGRGTSVKVLLPLCSEEPAEKKSSKSSAPSLEGDELILVVEDEDAIRDLIENILRRQGYRVLTASDGAEALELANNEKATIDLVISDAVMPRLSGPKFVEQLRKTRPDVRVMFISGYAHEGSLMGEALESNAEILEKPFSPTVLLSLLRRLLDRD
jgi:CheY-like chemotaxis protein